MPEYRWCLAALVLLGCGSSKPAAELRVCSDPNNLPFSNRKGEGLENHLAQLIGSELHANVSYTWWPQRRGFIRSTLAADSCDVVMGIPTGSERVLTTRPYYRSSYVFVSRKDRHLGITSFDDPALKKLKIGVQLVGDDYNNTPPVHALSRRGIVGNLEGFSVYGDYSQANPPARMRRLSTSLLSAPASNTVHRDVHTISSANSSTITPNSRAIGTFMLPSGRGRRRAAGAPAARSWR